MRVTIDVDEKLWKEIMKKITEKYGVPYGKYRKLFINEILKRGMKNLEEKEDFKSFLISSKISPKFLEFLSKMSKEIRKRSGRKIW